MLLMEAVCVSSRLPLQSCFLSLRKSCKPKAKARPNVCGYPRDSKLLIIHADDLAVAHSEDAASFDALEKRAATSASIMVPCPWLTEVAEYAKAHPDADLGLHLTLTSEWKTYRWGPVASKDQVPSLLDSSGYLWPDSAPAKQHIKADEAEREIRAQIEKAHVHGHPSHAHRQPHGSSLLRGQIFSPRT